VFTVFDTTGFHNMSKPGGGWHGLRFYGSKDFDTSYLQYYQISIMNCTNEKEPFESEKKFAIFTRGFKISI